MCPFAGTRIIYDRKFLLDRRNSPIAQTPPAHLPVIPGVTSQNVLNENRKNEANNHINNHDGKPTTGMNYVMQNLLNGEYMTYYCSKSLMYLKSLLGRF